ncbi:hypothetical protein HS088_TW04G00345 [Tripterygium wilfordii]|uniref:DUF7750 domain-containing protein n=1 Tax=Tripterygium wilfordii TaxID=458696 RepID=A0A7J7DPR7_TRIWF|nr:hypothetical protein HS088_TW04G00345 [Tripterygium wilfordii]
MNLSSHHSLLHLKPPHPLLFIPNRTFQIHEFGVYKRRRLKPSRKLSLRSQLPPLDSLFHDILSQFPSPESVGILAPVLGFASGVAAYVSQLSSSRASSDRKSDVGEWILFTSPTPFNRFVVLRCPSISIEGGEFLEDVNEKLIKEGRHFVKLNSGRMLVMGGNQSESGGLDEKLEYQRVCLSTEDGGVISMDWPANLDLEQEHGLDTTVLLVPGTPEGSMDKNVQSFVCEALLRGFFPIVMNPRGCARSPLTTARLFTAADSDDICTAIQFINMARPWTTLMAVGWGYGANMLTKYLAEVGEKTPLTAATCIDNPFDLEEATRSAPYYTALNQKLIGGMIEILRSNKELFQGRAKGFDVEKALATKSVREFEKAISMVSYGFEAIEEFYSKSCTREVIGNVRIPLLFIQNDDGTTPKFSIPRSLIAENPFTSLLLCSCLSSNVVASNRAAISWCQHLTIEWLTAVELGLLKGRHPLLKDVDVSINPSSGLSLVNGRDGRASDKGGQLSKLLDVTPPNTLNASATDAVRQMLEDGGRTASIHLKARRYSGRNLDFENGRSQEGDDYAFQQTGSVEAELVKEEEAIPVDSERGQVLETAQVVMNMLDVNLPGTLSEEEKKKVLTAVNQGETLMTALQDAVPEDVREKLTAAVSGILQVQRTNLKFDGLRIPTVSSNPKVQVQEKLREASSASQVKKIDDTADASEGNQPGTDQPAAQVESELQHAENLRKSAGLGQSQDDISNSVRKDTDESERIHEAHEFVKGKETSYSDSSVNGTETGSKPNSNTDTEKSVVTEESVVNEPKAENVRTAPVETNNESNIEKTEERTSDSSVDQTKTASSMMEEDASPVGSSSDAQIHVIDVGVDGDQKKDSKSMPPVLDQNKPSVFDSNSPTFSVSEALDALTGMDDSTQVAVNSVFGVIENMLSQLEENHDENKIGVKGEKNDSAPDKQHVPYGPELEITKESMNSVSVNSDTSNDSPAYDCSDNEDSIDVEGGWEEEPDPASCGRNDFDGSQGVSKANYVGDEEKTKHSLVGSKLLDDYPNVLLNNIPLYIIARAYGDPLRSENLNRYSISKIPTKKALDSDTTAALLLDYFPEEGQWKLLEQPSRFGDSSGDTTNNKDNDGKVPFDSPRKVDDRDTCIEPTYVILDTENQHEPVGEYDKNVEYQSEELVQLVKSIIIEALRIEVGRKLSAADMKYMEPSLSSDLLEVANAVSLAVKVDKHHLGYLGAKDFRINSTSKKVGTLHGEQIIWSISSVVQGTSYLRRVLPVGVIVGSCLAALRKYFNVTSGYDNGQRSLNQTQRCKGRCQVEANLKESNKNTSLENSDKTTDLDSSVSREKEEFKLKNLHNDSVMVGAVTAVIGASALLAHQNSYVVMETAESSSKSLKESGIRRKEVDKLDEATSKENQNSIVTSLAEKAMSVAGPVVPTKEDGEVDQERLVAMLADLGQKGGALKLVGKLALLWGGIRGAISLTDRLISFLHLSKRPLLQRAGQQIILPDLLSLHVLLAFTLLL